MQILSLSVFFPLLWICVWLGSISPWCPCAHSPNDGHFHTDSSVHLPRCPAILLAVCLYHHSCLPTLAHTPTETQEVRVALDGNTSISDLMYISEASGYWSDFGWLNLQALKLQLFTCA